MSSGGVFRRNLSPHIGPFFGPATVTSAPTKARIGRFVASDEPFLMLLLKYQLFQKKQALVGRSTPPQASTTAPHVLSLLLRWLLAPSQYTSTNTAACSADFTTSWNFSSFVLGGLSLAETSGTDSRKLNRKLLLTA